MIRLDKSIILLVCLVAAGASESTEPPHLRQARLIAQRIDQSHNEYAHKGCFIKWNGENGATLYENRTDCSDFLDLLLEHTYQFTSAQMKRWTGHERPLALDWYQTISAGNGFDVITNIRSIQPGDVIAIKFPPGSADTGHIMIAAGTPQHRSETQPVESGTTQWEQLVIDSSKSGHGRDDTRKRSDGTFARGVGQGTLRLYGHQDGTITGYSWSTAAASTFESSKDHPMVVGRLQPRK